MADVKWIKLKIEMFDDEKIKIIQSMPDGDSLLIIWIRLLTLAGKTNDGGYIYITDNMPYTDEMLSVIFNKPLNTVRLALDTFLQLGMIENDIKGIYLVNFEKYQSLDKLAEIREQTRKRVAKHRENKKNLLAAPKKEDVTLHVTHSNATDKDIDKDIDKDLDKNNKEKKKESKKSIGAYKNVKLTEKELQSLRSDYGDDLTKQLITYLDEYIEMKGYKAKSHYLCIKKWVIKAVKEQGPKKGREPIRKEIVPEWFNKKIEAEPCSPEEQAEMEALLSEFKDNDGKEDWRKEAEKLRKELNEKY